MKLAEITKICCGKIISGDPGIDIRLEDISTDSRTIGRGRFFIALKGDNFDGSLFAADTFAKGASGVMISSGSLSADALRALQSAGGGRAILSVKDTTAALQRIAACHRASFGIPVICITGSNGKTTVKDMIWHLLSTRYKVLRNDGTKNNHIGVPQTLLKLNSSHDICVVELGTNHYGEINTLAGIARPTAAVMTNIGASHLEYFKDLDGVFAEKSTITRRLADGGFLVVNGDDKYLSGIRGRSFRVLRYGFGKANDLVAESLDQAGRGTVFVLNNRMVFELPLIGRHNVYNASAAIAVAMEFGIGHRDARKALAEFKPAGMRLEPEKIGGIDVLNDAYNSNPLSMAVALEAIKSYPARAKWIVSADMLELGAGSGDFHRKVGRAVAGSGAAGLLVLGELSKHTLSGAEKAGMRRDRLWHCSSHDEVAGVLRKVARPGDVVLLKGSRSMGMEKVLESLKR